MAENTAENKTTHVSSQELMDRIRSDIQRAAESGNSRVAKFFPLAAKLNPRDIPPLTSSEELHTANSLFASLYAPPEFTSHRKGYGKIVSIVKRRLYNFLTAGLLKEYFEREQKVLEQVIRYLNFSSQAVDQKFGSLFWELIRKIDIDINGVNERVDRLNTELDATFRSFERGASQRFGENAHQLAQTEGAVTSLEGRIQTVENVARGLERTLALISPKSGDERPPEEKQVEAQKIDLSGIKNVEYLLLENRFRGSEEQIKESVKDYLKYLSVGPVLDLGCGRGELLELLREKGIDATGVDLDRAMIGRAKEKGLKVVEMDLFNYLATVPPSSVGGIIATQVVEHLCSEKLDHLITSAKSALKPGGVLILETINPQSVTALCRNFFRDPTHVFPVHPETLRFALEMKGIKTEEVLYRSPYPESAVLRPVEYSPELPARWVGVLQQINDNVTRLNDLLFGYQDFAVIGRV